jgi:hypothetical protein
LFYKNIQWAFIAENRYNISSCTKCVVKYRNELQEAMKIIQGLCNKKSIEPFWVVSRRYVYNKRKWEDNIQIDGQEVGCGSID